MEENLAEINKKVLILLGVLMLILIFALIYFSLPKGNGNIKNISLGNLPLRGNPNASIKIIEFSDFQCPACRAAEPIVKKILKDYPDTALYYRNFPLTQIHKNAFVAAEAAECADKQGKFWEYHDVLFENQNNLDKSSLKNYAKQIKLDTAEFNTCLDSGETKGAVLADLSDAQRLNLRGTPTFFINNKEVFGGNEQQIKKIIEDELK